MDVDTVPTVLMTPSSREVETLEEAPLAIVQLVELSVQLMEAAGIAVILIGATVATLHFFFQLTKKQTFQHSYLTYRQNLGRAIVVGLEFLIAGDIINTVVIEPTFESVGVLGALIAVRTFLSFTLAMEINKRWPWQELPPDEAEKI